MLLTVGGATTQWVLDVLCCNWLGLYIGLKICQYFEVKVRGVPLSSTVGEAEASDIRILLLSLPVSRPTVV